MTHSNDVLEDLNRALKLLHKAALEDPDEICAAGGICDLLGRYLGNWANRNEAIRIMRSLWVRWPEFSGDVFFPVPHFLESRYASAETMYWKAKTTNTMWSGEYGEARLRLLNWLIEQTEEKSK